MIKYVTSFLTNATNIIPKNNKCGQLFLGDYISALDPEFLSKNNISVVINCSPDIPFIDDTTSIKTLKKYNLAHLEKFRIPVFDSLLDHDIYLMESYFPKVLPFIMQKLIIEKRNVLIQCHKGAQRSACVVAALLFVLIDNDLDITDLPENIQDKSKLMKNVVKYIYIKRPRVFRYGTKINFKKALENYFKVDL
jgi:predicted protein tyrosine phosphatase